MARRYSGDAEVRLAWRPQALSYEGSVRDPNGLWHGSVSSRRGYGDPPDSSEAYDKAAIVMLKRAERELGRLEAEMTSGGAFFVRRVFQAPCPAEPVARKGTRR